MFAAIIAGYAWLSGEPTPSQAEIRSKSRAELALEVTPSGLVTAPASVSTYHAPRPSAIRAPGVYTDDMICLAKLIYWEARGEPVEGQRAVADVVMARLERRWRGADTVCEIARDPAQFEGMDREGEPKTERAAWRRALRLAKLRILGPWEAVVAADHFWAGCDRIPAWVDEALMEPVACIGRHWFWRHG